MVMDLLERDDVLVELRRLLHEARETRGCLLLIGGEAGVGKTALAPCFAEEARTAASVMLGQCDALSTPRALGPLFDVATADPALRRLLSDSAPRDLLFRAVLARFRSGGPSVMLVIEDAHWADEATLDLLRYLGRRIEDTRSLLIVTYRDDEVGLHHPLRQVLGDFATTRAVHRLTIPPLTRDGVDVLAAGSGIDAAALHA